VCVCVRTAEQSFSAAARAAGALQEQQEQQEQSFSAVAREAGAIGAIFLCSSKSSRSNLCVCV
jgi:hypothetical protein